MAPMQPPLAWIQGLPRILKDRQLLTFGFFLLISASMWMLNKLSVHYVASVSGELVLNAPGTGYVVPYDKERKVQLRVRARGYHILLYNLFSSKKFDVNLSLARIVRPQQERTVVPTASLRDMLSQQLGGDFELQEISPDTILFRMSPLTVKRVPVRTDFRLSFAPQYMQRGEPTLAPDSVTVSGPEELVRELSAIHTTRLVEESVKADLSGKIMLVAPDQTFLSHVKVAYSVSVQRFTQAVRELPIQLLHAPDSLSIALLPATAQVSLFVTLSDYSRLNQADLLLTADYLDLYHNNLSGQVQVNTSAMPDYVLSTSVSPAFVTIIVSKQP
ncbi:MAG: hypothetical protein LBS94_00940 [Prevotellaceae bacterium]|jgi:hypothetical protein|nr:hypothetical protein [Prevotellaceae bacterium]